MACFLTFGVFELRLPKLCDLLNLYISRKCDWLRNFDFASFEGRDWMSLYLL